jgi:hypothetical protein
MSKKDAVPLHIEWTPGWVRAVNIATGDRAEAVTLKKLGQITVGQKEAIVGIGRKIVFLKSIRLPKALPEDLRRIISVQLSSFFPLSSDQLSFDFIQTANQNPEGYLTIVAAIKADDLKLLHTELKEVGLSARRVLPIALASPVVAAKSSNVDALVVESNREDLALDVVQGGFLRYSRVTSSGSDNNVEYKRTLAAANVEDIPVIRAGEAGDGTIDFLHEAAPFDFVPTENRLIDERRKNNARNRSAVLLAFAALIIAMFVWSQRQQEQAKAQVVAAQNASIVKHWQSLESDQSAETVQSEVLRDDIQRAFSPGQKLSDIGAFVSDSLPANSWLTGLSLERAKPAQIRGTAMASGQVETLEDTLGASPRFANVKLIFANSALIGTTPVIQFNITADCVGDLSMPAPEKDTGIVETASSSVTDQGTEAGG